MSEDNKTIVKRFTEEYINGNDLKTFDELLDEGFTDHSPMPGLPAGKPGVRALFDYFRSAFSGFRAEIFDQAAEGDKVWTRKAFFGKHTGEFMGIAPTGTDVRIDLMDVIRIRGGRVIEHWNVVDQAGLLRQLGAA